MQEWTGATGCSDAKSAGSANARHPHRHLFADLPRRDGARREGYLADSRLEHCVKAALGGVAVPGHPLLPNFLVEAVHSVCERQQVAEPKGGDTVWEQLVTREKEEKSHFSFIAPKILNNQVLCAFTECLERHQRILTPHLPRTPGTGTVGEHRETT